MINKNIYDLEKRISEMEQWLKKDVGIERERIQINQVLYCNQLELKRWQKVKKFLEDKEMHYLMNTKKYPTGPNNGQFERILINELLGDE